MKIKWTRKALNDLKEIYHFIAKENLKAARQTNAIIRQKALFLLGNPYIGRANDIPNARELVITGTPYILFYKVEETSDSIFIVHVIHAARDWPNLV